MFMNIMSKLFCLLMLLPLTFACVSKKPIRTLKEVKKTYKRKAESIDKLMRVTVMDNRDMVAVAVQYLGKAIHDLENSPQKWKLKLTSTNKKTKKSQPTKSPQPEKGSLSVEENLEVMKKKIINQLFKVYAVNDDFNIRLLVLESLSQIKRQVIYDFYLDCLKTEDPAIIKMVLIKIRDYIQSDQNNYDLKDGFQQVLFSLNNKKENISLIATDTLFYFKPSEIALKSLKNRLAQQNNDFMKTVLAEKIDVYQEYLKEGKL